MRTAKTKDIVVRLEAEGWRLARVAGSHRVYKRAVGETIVVPAHGMNREVSPGVFADIAKKAGWK